MCCGKLLKTRGPFIAKDARLILCILQLAFPETLGTTHSLPRLGCNLATRAASPEAILGTRPSSIFQVYIATYRSRLRSSEYSPSAESWSQYERLDTLCIFLMKEYCSCSKDWIYPYAAGSTTGCSSHARLE